MDSNGDGYGDFAGAMTKLDYIKSLGVDCVWLMPIHPSPLVDDGYDVQDYMSTHPHYGSMSDFEALCAKAHKVGLKVITDFVVNHTSDQHQWFQQARSSPASPYREYYVWSDSGKEYAEVPIIFQASEDSNWTYDTTAGQYFWHRFFTEQPDLNYASPRVQQEMLNVATHWLSKGIDGFRVDAIPYLFEREGTRCENLEETHAFYRQLRAEISRRFPGHPIIGECNVPLNDLIQYYGDGSNEFHSLINFHFSAAVFAAIATASSASLRRVADNVAKIPPGTAWANYLRSHDELTLDALLPDERDAVVRTFGKDPRAFLNRTGIRRRLNVLLGGDRRKWNLAYSILFSFPGSAIIYYGDEIGMGDDITLPDRFSCRTPMQWTLNENGGFSSAAKTFLPINDSEEFGYSKVNVASQEQDRSSRLWAIRHMTQLFATLPALRENSITNLDSGNQSVYAYERHSVTSNTLRCVANLSPQPQRIAKTLLQGNDVLKLSPAPDLQLETIPAYSSYWFLL